MTDDIRKRAAYERSPVDEFGSPTIPAAELMRGDCVYVHDELLLVASVDVDEHGAVHAETSDGGWFAASAGFRIEVSPLTAQRHAAMSRHPRNRNTSNKERNTQQ